MREELKDIPIETMYKYLLRDYRALQQENRRLIDMTFDSISVVSETEFIRLSEKYSMLSKKRLINEIYRLLSEIERLQDGAVGGTVK